MHRPRDRHITGILCIFHLSGHPRPLSPAQQPRLSTARWAAHCFVLCIIMGRCQIGCHSDLHATPKTSVGTKLLCGQLRRHSRHRPALTDPVAGRLGHIRDRVIGRAPLASEPRKGLLGHLWSWRPCNRWNKTSFCEFVDFF